MAMSRDHNVKNITETMRLFKEFAGEPDVVFRQDGNLAATLASTWLLIRAVFVLQPRTSGE